MKSMIELLNFRETIKNKKDLNNDGILIKGNIAYSFQGKEFNENLEITIYLSGYHESGQISLSEGKNINTDRMHMDFNPRYQEYKFLPDKKVLLIAGNSTRLGKYKVIITEI